MEVVIRNNQRLIRINPQRVKQILKKTLKYLKDSNKLKQLSVTCYSLLEMSLLFVNDRKMQEMNLQYRGIDKPTDVLSFPQQNRDALCVMRKGLKKQDLPAGLNSSLITHHSSLPLGDIVINLQQAKRQAKEHGMTFYEELTRLLIHGLLHLLGYDHERNKYHARKMRRIEKELIEAIGKRVRASAEMRIYAIKKMDR